MFLTSTLVSKLKNIEHGFGTLQEPIPSPLQDLWQQAAPEWTQLHETTFGWVKQKKEKMPPIDALGTHQISIPIGVITADCVPILMTPMDGSKVAAIHCGWRGTLARFIPKLFSLAFFTETPTQNWVAAIGPSVGSCCYEVSEELIENFSYAFKEFDLKKIIPLPRRLDLAQVIQFELLRLGVNQIERLNFCTCCYQKDQTYLFHSFRREKKSTRQYSIITRKPVQKITT